MQLGMRFMVSQVGVLIAVVLIIFFCVADAQDYKLRTRKCDELYSGFCGPYFAILGASKCGTRALAKYLTQYPGISFQRSFSDIPLSQNWASEINWPWAERNSQADMMEYAKNFESTDWKNTFAIDKSTHYLSKTLKGAQMMHKFLPNTKLLVILCDPVKRTWSAINHWRIKVDKDKTRKQPYYQEFHTCSLMQPDFKNVAIEYFQSSAFQEAINYGSCTMSGISHCDMCSFLKGTRYDSFLETWKFAYGEANIHVIQGEELLNNPKKVIEGVLTFAGLDPAKLKFKPIKPNSFTSSKNKLYEREIPKEVQEGLQKYFRPMVNSVEESLQRKFPGWLQQQTIDFDFQSKD